MNFLAHLWLADHSRTSLAGSVLGDVVRGRELAAYPDDIALGIRLHRRVDAATDRHPLITAARGDFAGGTRRYAGIVLDLACDHLLARDWEHYSAEPLDAFCQRAGQAIADAAPWFIHAGGRSSDAARFRDLLLSYADEAGLQRALQRTATRLREPQALLDAARDWPRHACRLRGHLPQLLADLDAVMQAADRR